MKLLPNGFYTVMLQRIEDGEGSYGPYYRWVFSVTHEGRTYTLSAFSSQKTGPESKARAYAEALLGRSLEPDEALDTTMLPGESCTADVRIATLTNGRQVNQIEKLF